MHLDVLKNVISDSGLLAQGYRFYDGYVFTSIRHPANVFDAILIRNPSFAHSFGDKGAESSHTLNEHINYINKYRIDKAIVIADDISFLDQCPTLKHINIIPSTTAGDKFDFSPLYILPEIQSLRCSTKYGKFGENSSKMDYSQVCGLEDLCVSTQNDVNYQRISTLKKLGVSNYNGSDLRNLFCSKELDTLEISSCRIRTLDGIETAPKMQCLYLSHNRQLQDISRLDEVKKTLKALRIQQCSKICDFSVLAELKNLEYLFLEGSNKIPSLDFVRTLSNLKTLIINMEVEDGDISPCLNLSYAHCGRIRKHYNLKANDLPKGIYYRGNENIDLWRRVM